VLLRCSICYSFSFSKKDAARVVYLAEKIFRSKPKLTFNGTRFNVRMDFSGLAARRLFGIIAFLLNSSKRKLISQTSNESVFTLTYGVRDLVAAFSLLSPTFDYHGWNYSTSIMFKFSTFEQMSKFKDLFPPA